ncbi:MAG: stage V sporulation protein S [Caldilineaceae bacterium]|nr:stage V sporulation protein S [Caldilineaceae bacterium]
MFALSAAHSQPSAVAVAIANTIRAHRRAEVQAIGVSAVNQMMKATIIARRYLLESDFDLSITPDFADIFIDGKHLTAVKLYVHGSEYVNRSCSVNGRYCPYPSSS